MENKLNKLIENIKNHKKLVISLASVAVIATVAIGYSVHLNEVKQKELAIEQKNKSISDEKNQIDKLFEELDLNSDDSIVKLKEISETSLNTDEGKEYLKTKVEETVKSIIGNRIQKGMSYDMKDSDEKFKDKATLETNVKEITKQIDFIKKVDETFKQENLNETIKPLNDLVSKYQKQVEFLKKEEEKAAEKAKEEKKEAEKPKESSSQSNSSSNTSSGSSNSNVDYGSSEQTNGYSNNYGGQSYSGSEDNSTNYQSSEQYSSGNSNSGGNDGYTTYTGTDAFGHSGSYQRNHSNGDVRDSNGNHLGNVGGGIAEFRQR